MENNAQFNVYGLPKQRIPDSEKNKEWRENCVRAISQSAFSYLGDQRTIKQNKLVNYNIINGIFDANEFKTTLNPLGLDVKEYKIPQNVRPLNTIYQKFSNLMGEEIKRPFNFKVFATAGDVVNNKLNKQKEQMLAILIENLHNMLSENGTIPDDKIDARPLEELEKYKNYTFSDIKEEKLNKFLKHLVQKLELEDLFIEGFKDFYTVAEEFYCVYTINNEPKVRKVNPVYFDFDQSLNDPCVENASWCREIRYLTLSQIIDEYGEYLTDENYEKLETQTNSIALTGMIAPSGFAQDENWKNVLYNNNGTNGSTAYGSSKHIAVQTCCWVSMQEVKFLTYLDEEGAEQIELLEDNNFKLSPEMKASGASLKSKWVKQIWKGDRIGLDIFVNVEPLKNQVRTKTNLYDAKLPYIGRIHDSVNSIATSQVDRLKPLQYLKLIIWYKIENELKKAKGKKIAIPQEAIPKDMSTEEFMYYSHTQDVYFYSLNDESGVMRNGANNLFGNYDMSLSNNVQQYLAVIQRLDHEMDLISGITPERQGSMTNDTASANNTSISQSYNNTEGLFYWHNKVKQQVLSYLLNVASVCYSDKSVVHQYIVDDLFISTESIESSFFDNTDYGIFVTNSSKDNAILQKITSLAPIALQQNKITMAEIIKIFKSDSMAEIANTIEDGEMKKTNSDIANSQAQQKAAEDQNKFEQMKFQIGLQEAEKNRQTDLEIARIRMGVPEDSLSADKAADIDLTKEIAQRDMAIANSQEKNKLLQTMIKAKTDIYKADKDLEIAKENKTNAEVKANK
jgi:hypothetical protein